MGMLLDSAKWELTANGKHGCRKIRDNMSNQSVKIHICILPCRSIN